MLISRFNIATEDKIEEYEDMIGVAFPNEYRKFICKYNGGDTPNTTFKCKDVSSDIKAFYGIGNVKYSLDSIKPEEHRGESYLPIAFDSFGNEILISLRTGVIAFKDHENSNIKTLENSFCKFIKKCESKAINKSAVKSIEEREKELIARGRGSVINDALREMWQAEIKKYSSITLEEVVL